MVLIILSCALTLCRPSSKHCNLLLLMLSSRVLFLGRSIGVAVRLGFGVGVGVGVALRVGVGL
jgi:hypothetical protein